MKDQFVGITLMFALRVKRKLEGNLKSYILPFRHLDSAMQEVLSKANEIGHAHEKGSKEDNSDFVEYLGIEDLFRVVGPLKEGALLSRSTIYNQMPADATALCVTSEALTFDDKGEYVADAVYFIDDLQEENMRRIIVSSVLINVSHPGEVIEKAKNNATSEEFKRKIVQLDEEGLTTDQLQFVGFEDINAVKEDIRQNGAYQILEKDVESIDELREELLDEEEIRGFFENLLVSLRKR